MIDIEKEEKRVCWIPQVGVSKAFYIPVQSIEEGKKLLQLLAAYDCFLYNKNLRSDYCNFGAIQVYNSEDQDWEDWEDWDEELSQDLKSFSDKLFSQVHFD